MNIKTWELETISHILGIIVKIILDKSRASPVDCCLPPAGWRQHHKFSSQREENCERISTLALVCINIYSVK